MRPAFRVVPIALCAAALACSAPDHEAPLPDGGYLPRSGCSKSNLSALLNSCLEVLPYDYSYPVCAAGVGPAGPFMRDGGLVGETGLMPPTNDPGGLNYSVDLCNADGESSLADCGGSLCEKAAAHLGGGNAYLEVGVVQQALATWACYDGTRMAGEDQTCAQNCMNAAQTCMAACPTDTWDHCATCSNACSAKWRTCDQACPRDTATCDDGKKDSDETDVDCGGTHCMASCETGQHCQAATDCINGVCANGTCAAPTCKDGVKNGFESDVDCGGLDCPACKTGQHCDARSDCTSSNCVGLDSTSPGTCQ